MICLTGRYIAVAKNTRTRFFSCLASRIVYSVRFSLFVFCMLCCEPFARVGKHRRTRTPTKNTVQTFHFYLASESRLCAFVWINVIYTKSQRICGFTTFLIGKIDWGGRRAFEYKFYEWMHIRIVRTEQFTLYYPENMLSFARSRNGLIAQLEWIYSRVNTSEHTVELSVDAMKNRPPP